MSEVLVWPGTGPIAAAAPPGGAALAVTHTLLENHRDGWRAVASRIDPGAAGGTARDVRVVLRPAAVSNVLPAADADLRPVPADLDPLRQLLFPAVEQVFAALASASDPGWTAWVSGSGIIAELCLAAAPVLGARRTVWIPDDSGAETAPFAADEIVAGGREARAERLAALAGQSYGRVIGFETSGDAVALQALLAAFPAGAALVLPALAAPPPAAVNFYRDVHKKNVAILGAGAESRTGGELGLRVERWLRQRFPPAAVPHRVECDARIGVDPTPASGRVLLLLWPGHRSGASPA